MLSAHLSCSLNPLDSRKDVANALSRLVEPVLNSLYLNVIERATSKKWWQQAIQT